MAGSGLYKLCRKSFTFQVFIACAPLPSLTPIYHVALPKEHPAKICSTLQSTACTQKNNFLFASTSPHLTPQENERVTCPLKNSLFGRRSLPSFWNWPPFKGGRTGTFVFDGGVNPPVFLVDLGIPTSTQKRVHPMDDGLRSQRPRGNHCWFQQRNCCFSKVVKGKTAKLLIFSKTVPPKNL